eukprot:scaffold50_cov420-Prasinococcus_capsulatus_cf.AAC.19
MLAYHPEGSRDTSLHQVADEFESGKVVLLENALDLTPEELQSFSTLPLTPKEFSAHALPAGRRLSKRDASKLKGAKRQMLTLEKKIHSFLERILPGCDYRSTRNIPHSLLSSTPSPRIAHRCVGLVTRDC